MTIGSANPPPPSEGTGPGGEIDTAVPGGEAPAPWTPPAHWPPMPDGLTPAQVADWIARNRIADAQSAHAAAQDRTAAAMEAHVEQQRLDREQRERARADMNAPRPMFREWLAWDYYVRLPQVTGSTDLKMVDFAFGAADDFLKRAKV